jgi:hypothetical protein
VEQAIALWQCIARWYDIEKEPICPIHASNSRNRLRSELPLALHFRKISPSRRVDNECYICDSAEFDKEGDRHGPKRTVERPSFYFV